MFEPHFKRTKWNKPSGPGWVWHATSFFSALTPIMLMCHSDWLTLLLETKVICTLNNVIFFSNLFQQVLLPAKKKTLCVTQVKKLSQPASQATVEFTFILHVFAYITNPGTFYIYNDGCWGLVVKEVTYQTNHGNDILKKHYFLILNPFNIFYVCLVPKYPHIRFKSCDWFVLAVELHCKGCRERVWIITIDSVPFCCAQLKQQRHTTYSVAVPCCLKQSHVRHDTPALGAAITQNQQHGLHSNWALQQFEDMNGNIRGSARLFVTAREAEYIHTESGAMTTLVNHVLYSRMHTLQPASFSMTKALNGNVLYWHLSRPESANRQINVKPKERCYLNTANNQVIASTI